MPDLAIARSAPGNASVAPRAVRRITANLAIGLAAMASGCSGITGPRGTARVAVSGRVERSSTIALLLVVGHDTVPAGAVVWSVSPADAATLGDSGRLRLDEAASVTVSGRADGLAARMMLDVPAPPRIAFDMSVNGNRDIYSATLDGRDVQRLTDAQSTDEDPTVAGSSLVFTSYRNGNADLYAEPLTGGTATQLVASAANETQPALSRDGSRIAYASDATGVSKLFVASRDGTQARRLAPGLEYDGAIEASASWSPDGRTVAFMSTADGPAGLFTVSLSTGTVTRLHLGDDGDVEPAWSPAGDRLAFAAATGARTVVESLDPATGSRQTLTTESPSGEPAWLPDGRLVYVAWIGGRSEIHWLDPSVSAPQPVRIPLSGDEPRNPVAYP